MWLVWPFLCPEKYEREEELLRTSLNNLALGPHCQMGNWSEILQKYLVFYVKSIIVHWDSSGPWISSDSLNSPPVCVDMGSVWVQGCGIVWKKERKRKKSSY